MHRRRILCLLSLTFSTSLFAAQNEPLSTQESSTQSSPASSAPSSTTPSPAGTPLQKPKTPPLAPIQIVFAHRCWGQNYAEEHFYLDSPQSSSSSPRAVCP